MVEILFLVIIAFFLTSALLIPFINLMYKLKFQRQTQKTTDVFDTPTPIFDRLHNWKKGTPIGGGILVMFIVAVFSGVILMVKKITGQEIVTVFPFFKETIVIFLTFLSFGILGLYDDIIKIFGFKKTGFWGLRMRLKLIIQTILAVFIAMLLWLWLGIDILYIPNFGILKVGFLFVPFATFVIVSFTNAFNITDGLDGLSSGLLLIALIVFLIISASFMDSFLAIFIGAWIGALIAFLYFNVYPARIWLGDVGSMAFGATLAVIGLLLGKVVALVIIGGIFIIEVSSSLLQIISKKFLGRKLFEVSPLHLYFQHKGWEEPKIVMRFWLAGAMFAIFGLWLALLKG